MFIKIFIENSIATIININNPPSSYCGNRFYKIDSSTNELPLSEIDFSINPLSPETLFVSNPMEITNIQEQQQQNQQQTCETQSFLIDTNYRTTCISPLATNERPISCTCLTSVCSEEDIKSLPTPQITFSLSRPIILIPSSASAAIFFSSADHIHDNREKCDTFVDMYHVSCSAPAVLDFYSFANGHQDSNNSTNEYDQKNCLYQTSTIPFPNHNILYKSLSDSNTNNCPKSLFSPVNLINTNNNEDTLTIVPDTENYFSSIYSISDTLKNNGNDSCNNLIKIVPTPLGIITNSTIATTTTTTTTISTTSTTSTTADAIKIPAYLNPNIISPSSSSIQSQSLPKPHQQKYEIHNSDTPATVPSTSGSASATTRRQRHGIAGQMNYFKMLGFGGFGKKVATSANSLFSTAVISGSSSAPNLRDMIPSTASPSVLEGFGGVPPIRPLETLHNALSLKQLDGFLEKMTTAPLFKTPASSPPKNPSTPVPLTASNSNNNNNNSNNNNSSCIMGKQQQADPISKLDDDNI